MNEQRPNSKYHLHVDENGLLVKCYHRCKSGALSVRKLLTSSAFWIGITVSYPFEHALYEHIWPFTIIMKLVSGH